MEQTQQQQKPIKDLTCVYKECGYKFTTADKHFYHEEMDVCYCSEGCYEAEIEMKKKQTNIMRIKKQRRSKEEIAQVKMEKEEAKLKKNLLLSVPIVKLMKGELPDALTAIKIFETCNNNHEKVNNCFRRMLMMRKMFNPRENINKFMTGGGAEEVVHQLIKSVGFDCKNVSAKATVIDLEINVMLDSGKTHCFKPSLKNSGKISATPILENYRGKKRQEIRPLPPTFIIYTEVDKQRVRIVYIDHEIIRKGFPTLSDEEFNQYVFKNEDSNLTFKSGFLNQFIPRLPEEYVLNAEYPSALPECHEENIILLALAVVDKQLASYDEKKCLHP